MGARGYAKEMAALEWMYYGEGQKYLSSKDTSYAFSKSDTDLTTSTTGVYNAVYGANVWYQTNHEGNAFGVLPKYPAQRSGWRVITGDAGSSSDG